MNRWSYLNAKQMSLTKTGQKEWELVLKTSIWGSLVVMALLRPTNGPAPCSGKFMENIPLKYNQTHSKSSIQFIFAPVIATKLVFICVLSKSAFLFLCVFLLTSRCSTDVIIVMLLLSTSMQICWNGEVSH